VQSEAPYGIYKTKNGYICISIVAPEKVPALGEILGIKHLEEVMPTKEIMMRDRDKIFEVISEPLLKEDSEYWLEKMQAEGIWCGKVNEYDEVEKDPQVIHNQIIQSVHHSVAGDIRVDGCPIKLSETPASIRLAPPLLGEHNEEILQELGYTEDQIEAFKKCNII
jgi:crotonobetainyl-CoA:carnitine CoA-transferase CaiB-like acyl-CoA transferase